MMCSAMRREGMSGLDDGRQEGFSTSRVDGRVCVHVCDKLGSDGLWLAAQKAIPLGRSTFFYTRGLKIKNRAKRPRGSQLRFIKADGPAKIGLDPQKLLLFLFSF